MKAATLVDALRTHIPNLFPSFDPEKSKPFTFPGFARRKQIDLSLGPYHLRLATSKKDREAAFHLRFLVFNLELHEGDQAAFKTGLDTDEFDPVFDHLIVQDTSGQVVGTYRLQT